MLGHATHHDWRMAGELALAQIEPWFSQHKHHASLGDDEAQAMRWLAWLYFTPAFANEAQALLEHLIQRTGISTWTGCCAETVLANAAEYCDEPALAMLIGSLPATSFEIFSGKRKSSPHPSTASGSRTLLVHADPQISELTDLLEELSQRHQKADCHGGVCSGLDADLPQVANEVLFGGLSGIVFSEQAGIRSAFSQGCRAIGTKHQITHAQRHLVRKIDDRPAMDILFRELGLSEQTDSPERRRKAFEALPKESIQGGLLVEINDPSRPDQVGQVRNLLGIDPSDGTIAIAGHTAPGWHLRFCTRDPQTARADLIASCTALRESIEEAGQRLLAVVYISCLARGEHLFGEAGLEGQWVQHYLKAPVMIGFQANGEIHQNQLHAYSGVMLAICDHAVGQAQSDL